MVTPAWMRMMAAYNAEMNRRLYAAADRLTPAQRGRRIAAPSSAPCRGRSAIWSGATAFG